MEDFTYPEPDEKPSWWFRRLPKSFQALIMLHEFNKLLKDPDLTVQRIEAMTQHMERSMRALRGEEDG